MTQAELATLAGVSRRSVQIWENGEGYPKEDRLSRLIAVFLEYGAFTAGRERAEAEDLWQRVDEHAPQRLALFEANWFDQLLAARQKAALVADPAADTSAEDAPLPTTPFTISPHTAPRVDWGEAIDVPAVYGRDADIATLNEWAIQSQARVVALLGMGGIGKTTLAVAFARQAVPQFEAVVFRSLRNAPPLGLLLDGLIRFVANDQQISLPQAVADKLAMLAALLPEHRCLLVLDNLETIMQEGLLAGLFRTGYADYGTLIQLLGETAHRSCLLLTSREKPRELGPLEGRSSPVYTLPLSGLTEAACKDVLVDRGLRGTDANWLDLTRRYGGNPLALKLVSEPIREIFGGDISAFLSSEGAIFGGIRYLLDQQFQRLSPIELDALYWLAIGRELTSMQTLRAQSTLTVGPRERMEALEALRRRFLIERSEEGALFSLQPVILEYITEQLIELFQNEIVGGELRVLRSHAVLQTQVPAYVRQTQIRLLVQPLLARLINSLKTPQNVEQYLRDLLSSVRALPMTEQGYGGGSILNMLIHLGRALRGYDFSAMNVWQAYLADVELPDVDFSRADLTGALFTETFKTIVPVAFSPDGQFLAAGSVNGEIWLWRIADRQQIGLLSGHVGPVNGLAWSPNGQFLASAGSDALIILWAMPAGVQLSSLSGHSGRVWSTAFSPDGSMLASGGDDRTIRVWSVAMGEATLTLHGHQAAVASVAWHPDGSTIASASHNPESLVKFWSIDSGANTATLTGHTADIWSVVWKPDGSMLASGSADHTLKLWDVGGAEVATLAGHTARIRSLAWSANGKLIASGSLDQATKIWDADSLTCVATLFENTGPVNGVAFAPDSDTVASGGELQTIVLWSAARQESLATLHGYNNGILSLAFNPNGTSLASAGFDRTIRLWSVEQRTVVSRFDGHTAAIYSLAFSPDGMLLASGSGGLDRTVRLWSVAGTAQLTSFEEHTGPVTAVAWSRGQRVIASGSLDCSIKLWSPTSSASLATLNGHEDAVRAIAFSSNGALLASGSYDRTVRLWSVEQRTWMATYQGHTAPVRVIAWQPDDSVLASGGADHTIRLWNVASGSEIAVLDGHSGEIPALAWSPDASLLASGSFDGTIRLWNVANQTLDVVLNPGTGVVYTVAWSPDGQLLASGGAEGVITLWHVASRTPIATLHSEGPYARMRITSARGLTDAQKATLRLLGAMQDE